MQSNMTRNETCNKRSKIVTLQAVLAIENAIDSINDLDECEQLEKRLKHVMKKIDSKADSLRKADMKEGLRYTGEGSMACSSSTF